MCKDVVFHFNKKHLEDPEIPMWVIKFKGETFYVNHVECNVPWTTKETPDNSHTKGSIKVKDCIVMIDEDNCANLRAITPDDREKFSKKQTIRIISQFGNQLINALKNIKHSAIKMAGGGCGTTWYICDIPSKKHLSVLQLQVTSVRQLMPNEDYYKLYDKSSPSTAWIDDLDWEDLYEE